MTLAGRSTWILIAGLTWFALAGSRVAAQAPSDDALVAAGERFYLQGLGSGGATVPAIVQGDLRVTSADMPCVNCHRHSGWGTSEGPVTTPAVTGAALAAAVTIGTAEMGNVKVVRPPYAGADLWRALREGIDPAGRTFQPTMPRYELSQEDTRALESYLRSLSERVPLGVTETTLHLATIVGPGVDNARRDSMLAVLRAFVRARNAETRQEERRREIGDFRRRPSFSVYRELALHEWTLSGPPAGWVTQLERLYRAQPVYAVVGGLADDDWWPVHEFAQRHRVPVVLPQTPLPPDGDSSDGFYSLYFSRGVALEAKALAQHLATSEDSRSVIQLSRCGTVGQVAAAALTKAVGDTVALRSICFEPSMTITTDAWRELLDEDGGAVVAWLGSGDRLGLEALAELPDSAAPETVFLSSSLLSEAGVDVARTLGRRAALVHPFVAPGEFDAHARRGLFWMKVNGVVAPDRLVAVNTMFAVSLVASTLAMPRAISSREYFVERIEHMTSRALQPSAYPGLSFDFVRRFGSLGCRILKAPASPDGAFTEVEPWFVPRK